MTSLTLAVGQSIELNDGRKAVVRFVGPTGFAPGEWVGVELDEASGKNDGSVKGDRYFDCPENHGMFLRAAGVSRIVSRPTARPPSLARRESQQPQPQPQPQPRSPQKSPTKLNRNSTPPTGNATPPTAARRPLSTTAAKPRTTPSIQGPSSLSTVTSRRSSTAHPPSSSSSTVQTPRTSTAAAPATASSARPAARTTTSARQGLAPPRTVTRPASVSRRVSSQETKPAHARSSPAATPPTDSQDASDPIRSFAPPPKPPTSPTASQRTPKATAREVEDLQTKMKILERKRLEDRDKLKKMTDVEQERDKYGSIVQKMQSKMQAQSQELSDLRGQLKDSESRLLDIENIQAEHDAVVEMATLDREMAEETAEVLKAEVDALRSKNEEIQLELDILKEENAELGREMNPEERTSQGWLQLERSNERLREALLRLRDMTQEQEVDFKAQIDSLEDEVKDFGSLKQQHEDTREKLLATEADVEDIRQQLEAAMGAEDMIEELTERNMTMQEKIDDLTLVIEDLENLRELNDELEINHVEAEKQMQEEIDYKDKVIGEQYRRSTQQQQAIEDCEYTISRFRELVSSLQADLEDMRASRQITETESEELSSRSRAMMDLNIKLQMSAAKTQIKTIDLELKRLEAEEAAEHLAIVQLFLPDAFQAEKDSVLALLRFKRVGFKAHLLHSLVKERMNGQGTKIADEDLFAACSVLDRLTWISEMSERFVDSISGCSVQEFARYESALYEIEPVERALNGYIDALKREDLKEGRVDEELQRSMAVMSHLASLHIKDSLSASTTDMLMQTALVQSHLESTASALNLCKSLIQKNVPAPSSTSGGSSEYVNLFTQLDSFISNARGAKVIVTKTHRTITELQSRSLALSPSTLEQFISIEEKTSRLAVFGQRAGEKFQNLFGEEGREEAHTLGEAEVLLSRLSTSVFGSGSSESTSFSSMSAFINSLTTQLNELSALAADLEKTQEFDRPPAPWVTRSAEIRATKLTSVDTEAEVTRLNEVVRERSLLIRSKEQELEEQSVRVEMLEARMAEAQKRSSQLAEFESNVQTLKEEEVVLQQQLTDAQKDVSRLRKERDEWRHTAEERKPDTTDKNIMAAELGGASKMELDRARLRINSLESAIRYLQKQTSNPEFQRSTDIDWLETPLVSTPSPHVKRNETLRSEGHSAFTELLKLVSETKPVSLSNLPKNKLAWRPAAQTAKWGAQRKREDWAAWQEWENDIFARIKDVGAPVPKPSKKGVVDAFLGATKVSVNGAEVVIVDQEVM